MKLINSLRQIYNFGKFELGTVLYYFRKEKFVLPEIYTIEETITKIVSEKCSISRFGDGEFMLIDPKTKTIDFQKYDNNLANRLTEVISSNEDKLLIAFPESWRTLNNIRHYKYFMYFMSFYYNKFIPYINLERKYYNACISRLFRDYIDKSQAQRRFNLVKTIWSNRETVILEGENSKTGLDNDLFNTCSSFSRIICPSNNAFAKYKEILDKALTLKSSTLILISLGPTATVLAYDLYKAGYQAIDIGHIGAEYRVYLKSNIVEKTSPLHIDMTEHMKKFHDQIIAII